MPLLHSNCQVYHRRLKRKTVELAMEVVFRDLVSPAPLTSVKNNPGQVYTRRRLKHGLSGGSFHSEAINGDPHPPDQESTSDIHCDTNSRLAAEGRMLEVGATSRKRKRSCYYTRRTSLVERDPSTPLHSSGSNEDLTNTIPSKIVFEEARNALHGLVGRPSCRRRLNYNERNRKCDSRPIRSAACKDRSGCLTRIRRMKPRLTLRCKKKRKQCTRRRNMLLLVRSLLPHVPRNCKRKRSGRLRGNCFWVPLPVLDRSTTKKGGRSTEKKDCTDSDPTKLKPKTPRRRKAARIKEASPPNGVTLSGKGNDADVIPPCNLAIVTAGEQVQTPREKAPRASSLELSEKEVLSIIQKFMSLRIDDGDGYGQIVPYKAAKKPAKVLLDPETLRMWNKLMLLEDGNNEEGGVEKEPGWEEERGLFRGRVDHFISLMHTILGPRRFMPWKGSVVDSVVGVFLTQNVSDYLSSSAYMSLCAKFPIRSGGEYKEEVRVDTTISNRKLECTSKMGSDTSQEFTERIETGEGAELQGGTPDLYECIGEIDLQLTIEVKLQDRQPTEQNEEILERIEAPDEKMDKGEEMQGNSPHSNECIEHKGEIDMPLSIEVTGEKEKEQSVPKGKKKRVQKKVAAPIDWEELRRTHSQPKSSDEMDSVDWEAVRCAELREVAETIKGRGQHYVIASRIQEFLNRLVSLHGSIDLEWLRNCPSKKVKDYLLEVKGLGLKSVECVRLLALQNVAFPVDVNVGRIAIRLGWVPLQPLPEDLQLHLLENYPLMDEIQKYLWPRLCTIDQRTLYELHYHLITFGKVFCTKKKPNCNACPMQGDCRHFASAYASAKLGLPAPTPTDNSMVPSTVSTTVDDTIANTAPNSPNIGGPIWFLEDGCRTTHCEPIIEVPPSPEPQYNIIDSDIEDLCQDDLDEIPSFDLHLKESISSNGVDGMLQEGSTAMVLVPPEIASFPVRKLKYASRLRTEHQVYELPDTHPLVAEFDQREHDDPCPYLLAIWPDTSQETTNSSSTTRDENVETIPGMILIPCRTAMRSRFPLNGTYFQVNEVFADYESSRTPINVPRRLIWNLSRRIAYSGTSVTSIFRGLSTEQIQECFWRGFVCVRGFDRKTRAPRPLSQRFHRSLKAMKGSNEEMDE